jgi:DNA-3-methyladenine glycosylase II
MTNKETSNPMGKIITFDQNSPEIQYLCKKDKRLAKVISMVGTLTYKTHDDPYEFLIHEIIEQMLSTKAANKIFSRLVDLCGGKITPSRVDKLTDEEIKSIGTANSKVSFIRNVTSAVLDGSLDFESLVDMSDEAVFKKLTSFKGIGKWTANMYMIFVLNRMDILPTNDVAFLQSYEWLYKTTDRTDSSIRKKCKKWKPYSSIAARYLYRVLDSGLTKEEFHLHK